jgi:hypothetical protein
MTSVDVLIVGEGLLANLLALRVLSAGKSVILAKDVASAKVSSLSDTYLLTAATFESLRNDDLSDILAFSSIRAQAFFADLPDGCVRLRPCGGFWVGMDADEVAGFPSFLASQHATAWAVERVTVRRLRQAEPALTPALRGGVALADAVVTVDSAACEKYFGAHTANVDREHGCIVHVADAITGEVLQATWTIDLAFVETADGRYPVFSFRAVNPSLSPLLRHVLHRHVAGCTVQLLPCENNDIVVSAVFQPGSSASGPVDREQKTFAYACELLPELREWECAKRAHSSHIVNAAPLLRHKQHTIILSGYEHVEASAAPILIENVLQRIK